MAEDGVTVPPPPVRNATPSLVLSLDGLAAVNNGPESPPRPPQGDEMGTEAVAKKRLEKRAKKLRARDVTEYELRGALGEGQYGKVWRALDPSNNETVALKMIKTTTDDDMPDKSEKGAAALNDAAIKRLEEGFPLTSVREIKILKALNGAQSAAEMEEFAGSNSNIVELIEVAIDRNGGMSNGKKGSVYMVFEYLEADLSGLLLSGQVKFTPEHQRWFAKQLLEGMHWAHRQQILHRDLKAANVFISKKGVLKIGDWGLAKSFHENQENLTWNVITLWYRPPELLFGCQNYDTAVDMWSVGCIIAEILNGGAILQGTSEVHQLELIFNLCGTPDKECWDRFSKGKVWSELGPQWLGFEGGPQKPRPNRIEERFPNWNPYARDLVERLLTVDPAKRISASEALAMPYFHDPKMASLESLPVLNIISCHEYEIRQKHEEEKVQRRQEEEGRRRAAAAQRPVGPKVGDTLQSQGGWD